MGALRYVKLSQDGFALEVLVLRYAGTAFLSDDTRNVMMGTKLKMMGALQNV